MHGSVDSPDREIVLDDRDFARAYLSEGWATRFLLKLFETYTVVFIGYSFGDVIMRYLALGISSHARPRYIFLSEEDMDGRDNEWQHNGIIPIPYPAANGHHALVEALTAWTDYISSDYNAYKNVYRALSKMAFRRMLLILTMPALLYLQPRARNVLSTLLREKKVKKRQPNRR